MLSGRPLIQELRLDRVPVQRFELRVGVDEVFGAGEDVVGLEAIEILGGVVEAVGVVDAEAGQVALRKQL